MLDTAIQGVNLHALKKSLIFRDPDNRKIKITFCTQYIYSHWEQIVLGDRHLMLPCQNQDVSTLFVMLSRCSGADKPICKHGIVECLRIQFH